MISKIIFSAAAVMVLTSAAAFAKIDVCSVDPGTNSVVIEGTAAPNEQVLLTVVRKGASEADFFENMAYQYQKESGADGSFRFDFKMDEAALYTAYASTPDETFTYDFVFTNNASAVDIIERINAASSASAVERILREDRYAAGLFLPECDAEPDYAYTARLIYGGRPYSAGSVDEVINSFKEILAYGYVINGDTDNIFTLEEYLKIYEIPGTEIFTSDIFKESHQKEVTQRMKGMDFETRDEFEDAVTEQMALALIEDPNGYGNVELVCETFADRIGINTSEGSAAVYRGLYGKSFSDFGALKDAFEELAEEGGSGIGGSGGSGGSGGGGGGGGGSSFGGGSASLGGSVSGTVSSSTGSTPEKLPMDTEETFETVFTDLGGYDWALEAVSALYDEGIISGRTETSFAPAENVTRSEFVKMVVLAFDVSDNGGRIPFTDVAEDAWDREYISAAYNSGIIDGISAAEFGGSLPITRQDMAVIIQRAAGIEDVDTDTAEKFADDWQISNYAYNAAYALKSEGVMVGDDNNMFNPKNTASRAEAAKVVYAASRDRNAP